MGGIFRPLTPIVITITVRLHEYVTFSWGKSWFKGRIKGLDMKPSLRR